MFTRPVPSLLLLAAALLLAAPPRYVRAQDTPGDPVKTLRGTVRDAETGEPLPSASLFVEGTRRGTVTNREGRYTLGLTGRLPATVVVRFVGYETARRRTTATGDSTLDVALVPATATLGEVTVRAERGSAADIMRRVIATKRERRKRLSTYRADAYNRLVVRNDTGIVSVGESLTKFFWDKERGPREVALSQRQTANLGIDGVLPAGLFVTNLYDDEINVAGHRLVGVTGPEALDTYRFRLDSVRTLDGRGVYDISVAPRRRFASAFEGRVAVLDGAYALLEAELTPSRSFLFPPPIRALSITYYQQFSDFGKDFWLPISLRSTARANIALPALLSLPEIRVDQTSRLSDYDVNVALPDSLYDDEDAAVVRSATGTDAPPSDSLIEAQAAATVPLTRDEARAVATIDSTQTLGEAFAPRGLLADLADFSASVDDEEVASTANEDAAADSAGAAAEGLAGVDVRGAPRLWYNRVEGGHLGARLGLGWGERVEVYGEGGYQTARKGWTYGGGVEAGLPGGVALEGGYRYGVDPRYRSQVYDFLGLFEGAARAASSVQYLLGGDDYFDYYGNERVRLALVRDLPVPAFAEDLFGASDARLSVEARAERHFGVDARTAYDLLGAGNSLAPNPSVLADGVGRSAAASDESLRSLAARLVLGGSATGALGIGGQRRLALAAEYSPGGFPGNDFAFARFSATADYRIETFLRRRFLPMTLDVRLEGSTFSGQLPLQRFSIVEAQLGGFDAFGALTTLQGRPYEGRQHLAAFWEHNFRTLPFEAAGLYALAERGWNVLFFGGHGRTWTGDVGRRAGLLLRAPDGFHHEVGIGLSGLLGLLRLNVAKRLDAGGWAMGAGVARAF